MAIGIQVKGYRELNAAFSRADSKLKREWQQRRRALGEPTRRAAASKALVTIRKMPRSPAWAEMRVGATRHGVYVAPKKRGPKRGSRSRRNLAPLLMERAMLPALEQHETQILHDVDRLLATVGRDWER
jgi:hypothetical protein